MVRVLWCPVRPNSRTGIMAAIVPCGESGSAFGQQHRDRALGARLILRVWRICGDGALPPDLPLLALELACVGVEPVGTVLDHQGIGIRLEVVIPVRMLRSAALRGHHGIRAVVLHPHQGNLSDLAALPASGCEDHHRQPGATQRICLSPVRGFVALNLFSNPRQRTWLVVSIQRHASLLSAQAASVRMTSASRRASPISLTSCQTMLPEASRTNEPRSAQPSCSSNTSYVLATAPCGQWSLSRSKVSPSCSAKARSVNIASQEMARTLAPTADNS